MRLRHLVLLAVVPALVSLCDCDCTPQLQGLPKAGITIDDGAGHTDGNTQPWLTVNLGDADTGGSAQATLHVKSTGTGPLTIKNVCLVLAHDVTEAKSSALCVTQSSTPYVFAPINGTYAPGTEVQLPVTFKPTQGGPVSYFVRFQSDAFGEPFTAVELTARGTDGRLCADNGVLDFGDVALHSTSTKQITLTNCGVKPVTLDSFTFVHNPDDAFGVTIAGAAPQAPIGPLAGGAAIVLDVTFTPAVAGPYRDTKAGNIGITTAAPFVADYALVLVGNGVVPPACIVNVVPEVLNFGAVASGASTTEHVVVQSVGQCACTVNNIGAAAPVGAGFVVDVPALPLTLRGTVGCDGDAAGAQTAPSNVVLDVHYTSPTRQTAVADNASFDVTTSDLTTPTHTINLEANGGGAPFCRLDVSPKSGSGPLGQFAGIGRYGVVEFGRTSIHIAKRLPVTIKNIGNADCHVSSLVYDRDLNTAANEFSLETDTGAPAIPAQPFVVAPNETRTFFGVYNPTHTITSSNPLDVLSFGSRRASSAASRRPTASATASRSPPTTRAPTSATPTWTRACSRSVSRARR